MRPIQHYTFLNIIVERLKHAQDYMPCYQNSVAPETVCIQNRPHSSSRRLTVGEQQLIAWL